MGSSMRIVELPRSGASLLEETPVEFVWDSTNHSMAQDTFDLELKVNTNREMPVGAEEPIEQVQSVEWGDVDMHGEWKNQWAGEGFAQRTYEEVARLVSRTPKVRVEMGPHSLVGLLTNLKIRWRTSFEIAYSLKFSVHVNETIGSARRKDIAPLTTMDFTQRLARTRESFDKVNESLVAAKSTQFATEDLDNAEDNLVDLKKSIDNADFAVESSAFENDDRREASEMLDRAQHKLLAIAAAFAGIRSQIEQNLLDVQELVSTNVLAYNDVVSTLRFEEWSRTQYVECVTMIKHVKDGELDARARATRRPRGIHRVRAGDTLGRISMKWYGTPDNERAIRDANNLDSIFLTTNTDLIIPDVSR